MGMHRLPSRHAGDIHMNLEQMLQAAPPENSRTCKFGPWLATLPEDDRNAVHRAFDNPEVPSPSKEGEEIV